MIKAILCCDAMGHIGKNNDLLFHIPQDMKFFRKTTLNHTVLMGYNTYLSLGSKPLPKRKNIVLLEKERHYLIQPHDNLIVTDNLENIINSEEDVYVIGGAFVYNDTLKKDIIDEVLITIVPTVVEDADVKVDLDLLFQNFRYAERIEKFLYEELDVSIWRLTK